MKIKGMNFIKKNDLRYDIKGKVNVPIFKIDAEITFATIERKEDEWTFIPLADIPFMTGVLDSIGYNDLKKIVEFMDNIQHKQ